MEYLAGATGRHMVQCSGHQLGSRGREEPCRHTTHNIHGGRQELTHTPPAELEKQVREDFTFPTRAVTFIKKLC